MSDAELMQAYLNGDKKAFEQLYLRYRPKVYGYLKKKLSDPKETEDCFQAVFLKLHRYREHFNPNYPFQAWFFTLIRGVLIDHYRKLGRQKELYQELNRFQGIAEQTSPVKADADALDWSALSHRERRSIELRYFADASFDEIAKHLTTTAVNVRKIVSRSLKKLKKWPAKDPKRTE